MTQHHWFRHEADRILRSNQPAMLRAQRFVAHIRRFPVDAAAVDAVHDLLVELDARRASDSVAA